MKIINSYAEINRMEHTTYIKEDNVKLFLGGFGYINITVLDNALKPGKLCQNYTLQSQSLEYNVSGYMVLEKLLQERNITFSELVQQLKNDTFVVPEGYNLSKNVAKGVDTYSPFAKLKKTKIDNKLTPLKLAKAIISGQIAKIICEGHYTDDYAYDAAVNYDKGKIKNQNELAEEIIKSKGQGWWINSSQGNTFINCGQFLYYRVLFN